MIDCKFTRAPHINDSIKIMREQFPDRLGRKKAPTTTCHAQVGNSCLSLPCRRNVDNGRGHSFGDIPAEILSARVETSAATRLYHGRATR